MNFKRILVTINHSLLTATVFERALDLAQKEQANLMILHCLVDPAESILPLEQGATAGIYPIDAGFSQWVFNETLQSEIQQSTTWLQEYCQKATNLKIPTGYQYQIGNPEVMICAVAQQWKADLIVLGRHDQSAIAEFFTGSVSNYVIHHASCSVLVVKDSELS
ncbi:MAG: universal stress protein [Myxacorys chilensis ATA2-1-KO14]|jgi:nucleotide-binding universal stress UspA family protein|nr:universal stress protein [Myxacorys chilensis ATA2-1-KO14]